MPARRDWTDQPAAARARLRAALWPAAQAALAASLAWLLARRVLGHPHPFFAPIAAAIALSTSSVQRARRAVQLVAGVMLGIAIGETVAAVGGTNAATIGVAVLVALSAARVAGAGFVGEGMLFANQAAASAILIVALHRQGTAGGRLLDALAGTSVAFAIGILLFPAHPLRLVRDAERALLDALVRAIAETDGMLARGTTPDQAWMLATGQLIHRRLALLAEARRIASANVRIAPRRRHLRDALVAEDARVAEVHAAAGAVLAWLRAMVAGTQTSASPAALARMVAALRTYA